jgi:thioredoxin reductase (NADPH)
MGLVVDVVFVLSVNNVCECLLWSQVDVDSQGYIKSQTSGSTATNVAGLYACGDVSDPHYKYAA